MKQSEIERASKIYLDIKALDERAIKIEKYGIELAEKHKSVIISINYDADTNIKKHNDTEFVMSKSVGLWGFSSLDLDTENIRLKESDTKSLNCELSDVESLELIGLLLMQINRKRKYLIQQLELMGVKL